MKKALLLGALAFFAFNITSIQTVNAQDKTDIAKMEKEKKQVTSDTPVAKPAATKTIGKNPTTAKEVKPAAADKTIETTAPATTKNGTKMKNGTVKEVKKGTLTAKPSTAKGTATPNAMKPKPKKDPVMKGTASKDKSTVK